MDSVCICTRECDCEAPDGLTPELAAIVAPVSRIGVFYGLGPVGALCSNECPVHNIYPPPRPHPECEAEKHWFEYGGDSDITNNPNQAVFDFVREHQQATHQ